MSQGSHRALKERRSPRERVWRFFLARQRQEAPEPGETCPTCGQVVVALGYPAPLPP